MQTCLEAYPRRTILLEPFQYRGLSIVLDVESSSGVVLDEPKYRNGVFLGCMSADEHRVLCHTAQIRLNESMNSSIWGTHRAQIGWKKLLVYRSGIPNTTGLTLCVNRVQ